MLGALPGVIGTLQAMEALKLLAGYGESLAGRMLHYDATTTRFRELKLKRNPECALCGESPSITSLEQAEVACSEPSVPAEIDALRLREILAGGFDGVLLDVREPDEYAWAHIEGCKHIPLREIPGALTSLPPDEAYLVYCKVGQRSAYAASLMMKAGFPRVTNVQGGILAWIEAQGPVKTS